MGRHLSPLFFPGVPTYLARIMHRLHVGVWRCMCVPTKCECGMSVSFHHVMFSCTSCSDHFQPLTGKLRSVGLPLCTKSLAVCDQREGWSLLRAATRLVYTCEREIGRNYTRLLILLREKLVGCKTIYFGLVHLCRGDPCQDPGGK